MLEFLKCSVLKLISTVRNSNILKMAQVDHEFRRQFLQSLNVPDIIKQKREAKVRSRMYVPKPKSEAPKAGDAEGYVNAGALVSFVNNLSTQHRQDVLDCCLFAQLAADGKYDRLKDTPDWYKMYLHILTVAGWVAQSGQFEEYDKHGSSLEIQKAIKKVVEPMLSPAEMKIVEQTIDSLDSGDNMPWWEAFDSESCGPSENGNFQLHPCREDSSNTLVMGLGSFYFSAKRTEKRWFWVEWETETIHLFKADQVCTLNDEQYAAVRDTIRKQLGDDVKDYVGKLKLKKE